MTKADSGSSLGISPSTPAATDDGGSDTDWKSAYSSQSPLPEDSGVKVYEDDETPQMSDFGGKGSRERTESTSSQRTAGAHDTDDTARDYSAVRRAAVRVSMSAVGA